MYEQIIPTAQKYKGCKWVHQGRRPDAMDCAGLIVIVGKELGFLGDDYIDYVNYSRRPDGVQFKDKFDRYTDRTTWLKAQEGDILIFGEGIYNFHCGLLFYKHGKPYMIHAYCESGFVMETPLTKYWLEKMSLVYRYRKVK